MDEYQHFERLANDADFEEGTWIGEEFFYTKRKKKAQQTEDDRLYGVFQGSSDEEDGFKKRRRRTGDDSAALHKEVAFVSSGVVTNTTDPKDEDIVIQEKSTEGQGPEQAGPTPKSEGPESEDDEGEGYIQQPVSGTARMIRQAAEERRAQAAREQQQAERRTKVLKADPELAKFENHSKGIGSKLLKLMGWKPGEGLGRKKDGIAKPLEAVQRPKLAGLGAAGQEASLAPTAEPQAEVSGAAKAKKKTPESAFKTAWKARNRVRVAAVETVKTADDLLAEQEAAGGVFGKYAAPAPSMTILDFTGPQTRVVSNMGELGSADKAGSTGDVPFPELQHNLKLLVEITEGDIQRLDGKVRLEQEKAEMLQQQEQELTSEAERLDRELQQATQVLEMVQIMDQQAQQKPISLEELQTIFEHVKDVYPAEFKLFECDAIALSQLLPVLAHSLATWDPLQAPLQWLHVFSSWKRLLSGDAAPTFAPQDGGDAAAPPSGDAFSELCNEALLPPLRRVVMAVWDARAPLPLLQFFDHWMPVLPPATSAHVLRAMVLPRLQAAVNTWAADGAGPAVHVWLHPWLPHLSSELQHLFPMIRNKLSAMLKAWRPWEPSAHALLVPWQHVWKRAEWTAVTDRVVLPPLEAAMHEMLSLNPLEPDTRPCDWCLAWTGALSSAQLAGVYEREFFPRLHGVLHMWLTHTGVVIEEVWQWVERVKAENIPAGVPEDPRILHQFAAAHSAINNTHAGVDLPAGYPVVAAHGAIAAAAAAGAANQAAAFAEHERAIDNMSIRDFLGEQAAAAELPLVPRLGRVVSGLQVLALGHLSVIVDPHARVVKAFMKDRWMPMGIEEVIQEALKKRP